MSERHELLLGRCQRRNTSSADCAIAPAIPPESLVSVDRERRTLPARPRLLQRVGEMGKRGGPVAGVAHGEFDESRLEGEPARGARALRSRAVGVSESGPSR